MTKRLTLAAFAVFGLVVTAHARERFDMQIRNDFFAGFNGDPAAMARAMQKSEEVLAVNPKFAEALVWHGAGLFAQSRQFFMAGETEKGREVYMRGLKEMDEAVTLEPDNIAVLIPRGAVLMTVGRNMLERDPSRGKELLTKGLANYQHAYELQQNDLDKMGQHPLGELLFGIADTNSRLGDQVHAAEFFDKIAKALPNTVYAKRAAVWQETKSLPVSQAQCVGCHTAAVK